MCEVPRIDWMSGEPGERADDRLGDLGLDQLRAARPLRVDDDLRIGDVGDGVERARAQRVDAEARPAPRPGSRHDPAEADDELDDGGDHASGGYEPFSLCSASMKKLPNVTTCSPAFEPLEHLR